MSKKYQVFISSTYEDLKPEREQIIKACLEIGHIPVGMEMFSAGDEEQWRLIERQISEADYYVVIAGFRYGAVDDGGISYTEKEYNFAVSTGVPILGFVLEEGSVWPEKYIDKGDSYKSVERFRQKIKSRIVSFWRNKDELHGKFSIAFSKIIISHPRTGWTKANEAISPEMAKEIARLSKENSDLRSKFSAKALIDNNNEKIVSALKNRKIKLRIRKKGVSDFKEAEVKDTDLLKIFHTIAPRMIIEEELSVLSSYIGFMAVGLDCRSKWPVARNTLEGILVDYNALDLMEPSRKKHPVSDAKVYWSLTDAGRDILRSLRRYEIMAGLEFEEAEPSAIERGDE